MPDTQAALNRLKRIEEPDRQFSVACITLRPDSVIGLVPVLGDLVSGARPLCVISEAKRRPAHLGWTKGADVQELGHRRLLGALPVVGDIFDVAFKSNTMNVRSITIWKSAKSSSNVRRRAQSAMENRTALIAVLTFRHVLTGTSSPHR